MPMPDVDELERYMSGITFDEDQRVEGERAIRAAISAIETELNKAIEPREVTESVNVGADGILYLSRVPVTAVESVLYGVSPVSFDFYGGVVMTSSYMHITGPLTVTYTGGVDGSAIEVIRSLVLELAADEMRNEHVDSVAVNGLDVTDGPPRPAKGLSEEQKLRIQRYKRRVLVN